MEDRSIIALYNARDERAIQETERKYGDYCMSISVGILSDRMDAEECVNDTYLKAWNTIPPKQPSVLRTYLGKLVRNLSIDRLRTRHRQKRNRDLEVAMDELENCIAAAGQTSDSELCGLLDDFLARLDMRECRLFVGRYWYAYEVNRLAKAYGMTPNAVTKQLSRTREKLRAYLSERGYSV